MPGIEDTVGQLLFVGLPGTALDAPATEYLDEIRPGGIILFRRNIESAGQLRSLNAALMRHLQRLHPLPLLAVDQEWGPVNRLEGLLSPLPAAFDFGQRGDAELVREAGEITGALLRHLGFHLDLAPVVDLHAGEADNGIGRRAWSPDPAETTRMAGAFLRGLAVAGLAGVLKHFPGLGAARVDSHRSLPVIEETAEGLWERHLLPFRQLLRENPRLPVMVGHGFYPALQSPAATAASRPLPASLSPAVVTGLLRRRLGHEGLVLTDDLEMGAVGEEGFDPFCAVSALLAGADGMLLCQHAERVHLARAELAREVHGSAVLRRRAEESRQRLFSFAARLRRRIAELERTRAGAAPPSWEELLTRGERFLEGW